MNAQLLATMSDDILKKIKQVFSILDSQLNISEREKWLKIIKQNIHLHKKMIVPSNSANHGVNMKLQTNLGHLKRFQLLLTKCEHVGGSLTQKRSKRIKWEDIKSAFSSRIRSGVIINLKHKDPLQFLDDSFFVFKPRIVRILKTLQLVKVNTCFCGEFIKTGGDQHILEYKYFNTKNAVLDASTDLKDWFWQNVVEKILTKLEEFQEKFSGWALKKIILLEININKLEMGNGSSYIKLPKQIMIKHACVNVKNDNDEACFFHAVVSALYPVTKNTERVSSYPHYSTVLNLTGIEMPMKLDKITRFEKLNNISINVYVLELWLQGKKEFFTTVPARLTKTKFDKHVNLLMIQNKYFPKLSYTDEQVYVNEDEQVYVNEDVEVKYHFCWIKHISRLLATQLTKHKGRVYICDRCLNYFASQEVLDLHTIDCSEINTSKISFPNYKFIQFKNFVHKERVPFVLYCDFESILIPFRETKHKNNIKFMSSHTARYQKHIAFSAGYYIKCSYESNLSYFKSYRGVDCMEWFSKELEAIAKLIQSKIKNIVPLSSFPLDKATATHCHICGLKFLTGQNVLADHCHYTGKFRGFAHNACNLNYRKSFVVPVVFHNLSGYDAHLVIREIAKRGMVTLLPINKEKYISFTKYDLETNIKFRFIDSFRFLSASLDELVSNLEEQDFQNLKAEFDNYDTELFTLLKRKGVFPYDYVDSFDRLREITLPPRDCFYSKLYDCNITDKDYEHAQTVWRKFSIQDLGEYSDLYLKTDIMLLSDVFEKFRKIGHATYNLDPAWYFSLPGYTWDCMLKYTNCQLETIQDVDILLYLERGIRGGVSQCCNRFSEANHRFMSNYKPNEPSKYILYLDVNGLYGWSMMESLPYGGFEWMHEFENFDVLTIPDNSNIGYILEVDLKYPEHLHDTHRDLPLCPERLVPPGSKLPKLMTTFYDKTRYVIHYRNLKQALLNGIILSKIHRVLKFKQSAWLKPYIELNTKLRASATTTFEKNQYKLANNAVFGKTMENVRKHRIVKLVKKWDGRYGAKNLISSPSFNNRTIFDENLMAIEMNKMNLVFNKPLYIGMAILDISKTCVYDFHYDYMLKKFNGSECKLLYTDTDSLIYEIKCDDVYQEVIKKDIAKFDTSDYPTNNIHGIPLVNKKIPGLMKDENNSKCMTHFIGLRSKMYAYLVEGEQCGDESEFTENEWYDGKKCTKKSKGIKYNVVKRNISFNDYLNCLSTKQVMYTTQRSIRSYAHDLFSIEQTKIALSPYDDKRHILPNTHDTLPWGHYSLMRE